LLVFYFPDFLIAAIPNLPPFDSKRFKYTLCLDIDHTLLRSRNLASPHHAEADPEFFNLPKSIACRFIFDVDKDRYQTILRPYVIEFLRRMSELGFEIILFTSGGIDYSRTVGRILNQRAGSAVIHHCVARDQVCLPLALRQFSRWFFIDSLRIVI
jgi:TFIIF-interacting CTD phosphatase-like protein